MLSVRLSALCAIAVVGLSTGSAVAAPIVLDQSNQSSGFNGAGFCACSWQQGIVAGLTGALVEVRFLAQSNGSVDLFINAGAPWQADEPEYVESVNAAAGWNSVLIDVPIFMTAGTTFTLGFRNNVNVFLGGTFVDNGGAGNYAPGDLFLAANDDFDGWDLSFRTYVDTGDLGPQPVPEPGSIGLVGIGLAAAAVWRRARRRQ